MICFHYWFFWYLSQQASQAKQAFACCDLLSLLIFLIFIPTQKEQYQTKYKLWFAFIIDFSDIYPNYFKVRRVREPVVICFHYWFFWYLSQRKCYISHYADSCDLLSLLIFLIFIPTFDFYEVFPYRLWFAFIIDFSDIYPNAHSHLRTTIRVVICFHYWFFWYLSQQEGLKVPMFYRCDLLSLLIFLIFIPTIDRSSFIKELLWFAFIIDFSDIYPNCLWSRHHDCRCDSLSLLIFLIFIPTLKNKCNNDKSCDLLSLLIFLIFIPTDAFVSAAKKRLWFAFIIHFSYIYSN